MLYPSDVMIATTSALESTSELRACNVESLQVWPREEQCVVHEPSRALALHPSLMVTCDIVDGNMILFSFDHLMYSYS